MREQIIARPYCPSSIASVEFQLLDDSRILVLLRSYGSSLGLRIVCGNSLLGNSKWNNLPRPQTSLLVLVLVYLHITPTAGSTHKEASQARAEQLSPD